MKRSWKHIAVTVLLIVQLGYLIYDQKSLAAEMRDLVERNEKAFLDNGIPIPQARTIAYAISSSADAAAFHSWISIWIVVFANLILFSLVSKESKNNNLTNDAT